MLDNKKTNEENKKRTTGFSVVVTVVIVLLLLTSLPNNWLIPALNWIECWVTETYYKYAPNLDETIGLEYEKDYSLDGYVCSGAGNAQYSSKKMSVVVIAEEYEGNAVVGIKRNAFKNYKDNNHIGIVVIPKSVKIIGENAFSNCGLTTIVFRKDSLLTTIEKYAFYNNPNIEEISLPTTVEYIGEGVFAISGTLSNGENASLKKMDLASNVKLKTIGAYAFCRQERLEVVILPVTLTEIGNFAFEGCSSLKEIEYRGKISQWNKIKGAENISIKVKCTDGYLENQTP